MIDAGGAGLAVDDERSFEQLVAEHQHWIRYLAKQYARRSLYHDTEPLLFNQGLRALWESWRKFDPSKHGHATLKSFAWKHVEGAIKDALIEENTVWWAGPQYGSVVALDAKVFGERSVPFLDTLADRLSGMTEAEHIDLHLTLARALSQLPESEQVLLALRFVEDLSLPQIADVLDASVSHVWKMLDRIYAKLRRRMGLSEKEQAETGDMASGGDAL